jgi:mercuric reductase
VRKNSKYDLVIVGGGAAGFAAALKANSYDIKSAMVERGVIGGTCINVGCIPSKHLLGAGEILYSSKYPMYASISSFESKFDFTKTIAGKDYLVKTLRKEKYHEVLDGLNVELIEGQASFMSEKQLKVNGKVIEADKYIIATGSSTSVPSVKGIDKVDYITSKDALSLKERPSSMIVIGGRALGLEFAQMYSRFGTKVTILERSNRIAPDLEPNISDRLYNYLTEEGIDIVTGVRIKETYQKNDIKFVSVSVTHSNHEHSERIFEAEQLLMATGRKPNTEDLHLKNARVRTRENDGAVIVNSEMHTSAPHIWAGGDVTGKPMLEALAAKEGATAAQNALTGTHRRVDFLSVPSAIFTSPQVASVGLTEDRATKKYGYCSCRTLEMKEVPKGLTINETKGLIKMVVDSKKNNRILGIQILANIAAEMIHEAVMAIKYRLTIDDIIDTVHVFPTMSEGIKLVATSFKQDVRKLPCCAE